MSSNKKYKQGIFYPSNPAKCLNTKGDIEFRSMLEFKVMRLCDLNPNVLEWSSEKHIVPYQHPIEKRIARYFIDFYIKIQTDPNTTRKCLVEVKPERQTKPPVPSNRKKMETVLYENIQYTINKAKWEAAKQYAKKKGLEFMLLTENDIDTLTKKI